MGSLVFFPVNTCSSVCSSSTKKKLRHVPQTAERVLDAPNYVNDYCE